MFGVGIRCPVHEFGEPFAVGAERRKETRKAWNDRSREYKSDWSKAHAKGAREFAGFDGEGWEGWDGGEIGHNLYILRAGGHELYTGKPLHTAEVFDWLTGLPREFYYVGFALGYDLTMILRGLPRERFLKLHNRQGRTFGDRDIVVPVDWGPFRLDWIVGKRFAVWRADDTKKRFQVEDVVGCFQCSFAKAIRDWEVASPKELAFIEDMKGRRAKFDDVSQREQGLDLIRRYNDLECVLLSRMMERVRDACDAQKIRPTSWFGAGQLAQALLRKNRARDYMQTFDPAFQSAADAAYYGGFFDTSRVGYFPEMYEYDISSAYPHIMRELPCLAHAKVSHMNGRAPGDRRLLRVRWEPWEGVTPTWGAFPLRHRTGERFLSGDEVAFRDYVQAQKFTPGTLYYPLHGEGWYWDSEVLAVAERGEYNVSVLDAYTLTPLCDCEPFSWIPELYEYRKKLGKSGQGMVLKLGMNSLYGKLAQSVGRPRFANVVYAGMITSGTRAMIHDTIRKAGPENVCMVATDAVYSRTRIEGLCVGNGLGEWEEKECGPYIVILPGLHYPADASRLKTRSIPASVIRQALSRIEAHWYSSNRWESIQFHLPAFISCQLAYQLGRDSLAGQWVDLPRSIRFGSPDKRIIPDTLSGDSVPLALYDNLGHVPTGHRAEWDYAEAVRQLESREKGMPDWESAADSQPDWIDPRDLW